MREKQSPMAGKPQGRHLRVADDDSADAVVIPFEIDAIERVDWGRISHRFVLKIGAPTALSIVCVLATNKDCEPFVGPRSSRSPDGRYETNAAFSKTFSQAMLRVVLRRIAAEEKASA